MPHASRCGCKAACCSAEATSTTPGRCGRPRNGRRIARAMVCQSQSGGGRERPGRKPTPARPRVRPRSRRRDGALRPPLPPNPAAGGDRLAMPRRFLAARTADRSGRRRPGATLRVAAIGSLGDAGLGHGQIDKVQGLTHLAGHADLRELLLPGMPVGFQADDDLLRPPRLATRGFSIASTGGARRRRAWACLRRPRWRERRRAIGQRPQSARAAPKSPSISIFSANCRLSICQTSSRACGSSPRRALQPPPAGRTGHRRRQRGIRSTFRSQAIACGVVAPGQPDVGGAADGFLLAARFALVRQVRRSVFEVQQVFRHVPILLDSL